MGGAQVQAGYEASSRLAFRAWGGYAAYSGNQAQTPFLLMNPAMNQTAAGGALEFMFTKSLGLGTGINYEYNPIKRKLEPRYIFYPVIKSKDIQIKFW
jgi:hypothetical protein